MHRQSEGKLRTLGPDSIDRKKQSALYVDITVTGAVGSHPGTITREDASEAINAAERLAERRDIFSDEYQKLGQMLSLLFRAEA